MLKAICITGLLLSAGKDKKSCFSLYNRCVSKYSVVNWFAIYYSSSIISIYEYAFYVTPNQSVDDGKNLDIYQ